MIDSILVTDSPQDVLKHLNTNTQGLGDQEVVKRRQQYGENSIKSSESSWKTILGRQVKSSFVYLLFFAFGITMYYGEYIDAAMILIFLSINTALGFYQEFKSEKTLKLLRNFISAQDSVIRNGKTIHVPVSELVPGDILLCSAGDLLPADVRFIETSGLMIDETVMTGESVPDQKVHEGQTDPKSTHNIGFSGTTVVSGRGTGVVFATGERTEYAGIARLVTKTIKRSIFEREIDAISKFVITLGGATLVFIFVIHVFVLGESDIGRLLLFSVALAVSVIPEALPLVTTFSLSIGAMRLAKEKVVVKRLSAIEDLGSIEVLCSDKTGTLTENKLTLDSFYGTDKDSVIFYGSLAIPEADGDTKDPFDIAILSAVPQYKDFHDHSVITTLPFDPDHKRTTALAIVKGKHYVVSRGAPESVLSLCSDIWKSEMQKCQDWVADQGKNGKRVLAVSRKKVSEKTKDLRYGEKDMEFVGMLSFIDPIKSTTQSAVDQARELGVTIKILTGDSRDVSAAVAYKIGLIKDVKDVITGDEFEALDEKGKRNAVEEYQVFARVNPSQKHRIVSLLEENYEVGFLGEGINDAPALKAANVAIAVASAADIAREASDIVLLEKSLAAIVNGIRQGRSVFVNTTKYITATLSANFGNFFAIVLVSLKTSFLPMLALQILLLNLLSDFPMIAVATDSVDGREIRKPQRYSIKNFAVFALLLGIVSTVFDFIFFAVFVDQGESVLQTSWFMGSVLTELAFLFSVRTRKLFIFGSRPSAPLLVLTIVAALTTVALPFAPLAQQIFSFTLPTVNNLMIIGAILFCYILATEGVKALYYRLKLDMKLARNNNGTMRLS